MQGTKLLSPVRLTAHGQHAITAIDRSFGNLPVMPNNFLESYESAASAVFCGWLGRGVNTYRMLATLVGRGGEVEQQVVDEIGGVLDLTIRQVCGRSVPPPPIEGGNCPEPYGIDITYSALNIDGTVAYTITQASDCAFAPFCYGPVGSPYVEETGGFQQWFIRGLDANGGTTIAAITDAVSLAFYSAIQIDSLTFFPCSGEEETCVPRYRLPPTLTFPINIGGVSFTYDAGGGDFIDVSGDLTILAPSFNVDGRLSMPFNITLGPNSLNFNPTFNGDFTLMGGGTQPPPPVTDAPYPRPPTTIVTRPSADGTEPPEPEPPPDEETYRPRADSVFYGIMVVSEVTDDSKTSVLFQGTNPDIHLPSLGHVNFFYRSGNVTGWSEDIKVKNVRQLIVSPDPLRTTSAAVTPQNGVNLKFFPVYMSAREFLGLQSSLV